MSGTPGCEYFGRAGETCVPRPTNAHDAAAWRNRANSRRRLTRILSVNGLPTRRDAMLVSPYLHTGQGFHMSESQGVERLFQQLLAAWNDRDARRMATLYAPAGGQVGFDGSTANGPAEIEALLAPIFKDHPTARYIAKVREVRMLGEGAALLRAVAGMVPPGKTDLMPERNAIQTLVASRQSTGEWKVEMFHNTPAKFDGRPELAEKLTAELREQLSRHERSP